jgi:3-hydroxybutyryl-CoA dehydratase
VGDRHPLYFDEAYAKASPYGGLIAPPSIHILLMFSCTPADDWMRSPGTINAGQSWSYNIPGAPRRHDHAGGARAGQVHPQGPPVRRARQRLLQPARPGDLLRPRPDHPPDVRTRHDPDRKRTTPPPPALKEGTEGRASPSRVTRETIRAFCEASLDFNPLHLDDDYMKGSFGKTSFGGIIMHGMNNFGVITHADRLAVSRWAACTAGWRRAGRRRSSRATPSPPAAASSASAAPTRAAGRWDVASRNQRGEKIAQGEAMVEFPLET